jgi:hypothetical protein
MKIHCAQLVEGALRSALEPAGAEEKPPQVAGASSTPTLLDSFSAPKPGGVKLTFLEPEDHRQNHP